jgi:DNA polymerase-1
MNLGILYGMGVMKLARSLGVEMDRARELMHKHNTLIPEARGFLKDAEYWARKRGWVRTKLNRRRRFPNTQFAHKAGNAIIQGTSADQTKLKMVEIDAYFTATNSSSALMLQVHDELNWSMAEGEEKQNAEAQRIMVSFGKDDKIQFDVPMAIDSALADDWARASFPQWKGVTWPSPKRSSKKKS